MNFWISTLVTLFSLSAALNIILFFLLRRLVQRFRGVEEKLEFAIEKLDDSQEIINGILNTPLFYDSPQIRSVLIEIEKVKNTVLDMVDEFKDEVSNFDEDDLDDDTYKNQILLDGVNKSL